MTAKRGNFLQTSVIAAVVFEELNGFSGKTAAGLLVDIENMVSAGFPQLDGLLGVPGDR